MQQTAGGRWAGVLLHPTSLAGPYGIGDIGPAAVSLLDWLARAGQSVWQILPLGPPDFDGSPYGALSAFAANPLLISPDLLAADGLVAPADLAAPAAVATSPRVDFDRVAAWKEQLHRRAFERLQSRPELAPLRDELTAWQQAPEQRVWLDDWALFTALRLHHGRRPWYAWPAALRDREPAALEAARRDLAAEIAFESFQQAIFARQWQRLRAAAAERGIGILGDLPIYLAAGAADLWIHRGLFDLDAEGRPLRVAGVPPDYFSADGQLWGNPLYRWDRMAEDGYRWWIERLRTQLARTDFVRLDHFRGFEAYWELPADARTARDGRWVPGPGKALFDALRAALGGLPLVAEDLGEITPAVDELRRACGVPGMKVLQFAFGAEPNDHLPHRLGRDTVLYTGTHDNDTARGWYAGLDRASRRRVLTYVGGRARQIHEGLLRAAYTSPAQLAVAPVQDLLGLGRTARMNRPGQPTGNWGWRLEAGALTDAVADRVAELVAVSERKTPAASAVPAEPAPPPPPPSVTE